MFTGTMSHCHYIQQLCPPANTESRVLGYADENHCTHALNQICKKRSIIMFRSCWFAFGFFYVDGFLSVHVLFGIYVYKPFHKLR